MSSKVVLVCGDEPTINLNKLVLKTDIENMVETSDLASYALKGSVEIGTAPASASAAGTAGTIIFTATAMYVCVATDTWVKAALATWA